jgi:hypothetical protein
MERKEGVFWVVLMGITIGVLALVTLPSTSSTVSNVSSSSSTQSEGALVFASPVSAQGLELDLTLNATAMRFNVAIAGQVTVVNTLNQNVTISVAGRSQNLTTWSSYINVCPSDNFMGYVVFPGRVTSGNVSSVGTPLRLAPNDTGLYCAPEEASEVTFLPGASQTRANETFVGNPPFSGLVPDQLNVTTTFTNKQESCGCATPGLVGYYQDVGNGIFFPFSHGEYTVVAWDDWNQYVYVTFVAQG